jgi:hypothetical protein
MGVIDFLQRTLCRLVEEVFVESSWGRVRPKLRLGVGALNLEPATTNT